MNQPRTQDWTPIADDPHEAWVQIEEFPDYSVSDKGRIRNNHSGLILATTVNQFGTVKVGLSKDTKQYNRSVALLVAQYHLQKPHDNDIFDTPINLDGDRYNNRVENLMWRPRWFAIKYHKQFHPDARKGYKCPIQATGTGIIYKDSMEAATTLGILAEDTVLSVINGRFCFPTFQKFKLVES